MSDIYIDFISPQEEVFLIETINSDQNKWVNRYTQNQLNNRRMQSYGFQYIKGQSGKESIILAEKIPDNYCFLLDRLELSTGIRFNQMTINEYLPGQGIDAHYDHKTRFGNYIAGLTLGSGCNLIFEKINCKDISDNTIIKYLSPRSLYLMKDELRYDWMHKIQKVFYDYVDGKKIKRSTRWSLTFRIVNV